MNPIRKPFKYTFYNATMAIVFINVAMMFVLSIFPRVSLYGGLSYAGLKRYHFFWQPVTYLFIHGGWRHLLFNMLALFFFGLPVEKACGTKEFLLFYFVCGIIDGIFCTFVYHYFGMYPLLIGASGAIYAVLFAYAVIYPRNIIYIWGLIPVPAPILVLVYAVIEFFSQFFGASGTSHIAHLSGLLLAWIYFVVRMGIHPTKVWRNNR